MDEQLVPHWCVRTKLNTAKTER